MTNRMYFAALAAALVSLVLGALATATLAANTILATDDAAGANVPTRPERKNAPSISAVAFLRDVIGRLVANDYSVSWTSLDPRQQRLVPREAYVRCESLSPIPGQLDRIEVLNAQLERIVVPGSGGPARRSTVATFRLTFAPLGAQRPAVVRVHAHALSTNGHWTWMLPAKRLALHRSGRCGVSPPYTDPTV